MQRVYFLFTMAFVCNSTWFYAADHQLICRGKMLKSNSLAGYILDWPSIIQGLRKNIAEGVAMSEGLHHGTQVAFQSVPKCEQQHKLVRVDNAQHSILRKENGNAKITYHDFAKVFTLQYVDIQRIDYFLSPAIAHTMREVSLEYTDLTSFEEIQAKIVSQCPSLKKLNLNHNKLQGTLDLMHSSISEFTATHNNFSLLGEIRLPNARLVDLRYNPSLICLGAPEASVSLFCSFFIDNPEVVIESIQDISFVTENQ